MNSHDRDRQSTRQPLLLNFARSRRACDADYRYDELQHLNVRLRDGVPVVAMPEGRARLKTLARSAED